MFTYVGGKNMVLDQMNHTWILGICILTAVVTAIAAAFVVFHFKRDGSIEDKLVAVPFPPNVWGPRFWFVFHTVAMAYPLQPTPTDKQHVYDFIGAFAHILPCPKCREHFATILSRHPVADALGSREELMTWAWQAHNIANVENGGVAVSRADAVRYFKKLQAS
jgi:hypothetical protein